MRVLLCFLALVAGTGCQPRFKAHGALSVDGMSFEPVACEVLAPRSTGVAFTDTTGRGLSLTLPPQRLDAWRELRGTPTVALTRLGQPPRELGSCGELRMQGEGYHGDGKRASSGSIALDCAALEAVVTGALTFTGCF